MSVFDSLFKNYFNFDAEVIVFDTECTDNGPEGNAIHPMHPLNKPLTTHVKRMGFDTNPTVLLASDINKTTGRGEKVLLVGHNIKFDLLFLLRDGLDLNNNVYLWDTSVFHYLLSGMTATFPSLVDVCEYYKIPFVKDPEVLAIFKSTTIRNETIPVGKLDAHCRGDVEATYEIYLRQTGEILGMDLNFQVFQVQMQMLKVLTLMEYNGLALDIPKLRDLFLKSIDELSTIRRTIEISIGASFPDGIEGFNATASRTLSTLFFYYPGIKHKRKTLVGTTKDGKPKYKLVEETTFPLHPKTSGLSPIDYFTAQEIADVNTTLGFSVDEKVLEKIKLECKPGSVFGDIAEALLKYRALSKLTNTYLEPILEWCVHASSNKIHPQYQNTATKTGRLSSAKPNGQNLPPVVQDLIVPTLDDYVLMTVDIKQLEVCGLGQVSKDPQLIKDLNDGVDIHKEAGKDVYSGDMTKEQRRTVKGIIFGLIYGGGRKHLAEQSGVSIGTVGRIIDAFHRRYPGVKHYYNELLLELCRTKEATGRLDKSGKATYHFKYTSPTGRIYYIGADKKGNPSYTQSRSYPIQGWSTGDIVPYIISLFNCTDRSKDIDQVIKYEISYVKTCHDDVTMQVHKDDVDNVKAVFTYICDTILPEAYQILSGEKLLVPLKLEFTIKGE